MLIDMFIYLMNRFAHFLSYDLPTVHVYRTNLLIRQRFLHKNDSENSDPLLAILAFSAKSGGAMWSRKMTIIEAGRKL